MGWKRLWSAPRGGSFALALAGLAASVAPALAQEGSAELRSGTIEDDVFVAGRSVDVGAAIEGDLFVIGGWVDVHADVSDNLLAAGGAIDIAGSTTGDLIAAAAMLDVTAAIGDNLVAGGGIVTVDGTVASKLFASGARIRVGRRAEIAGNAWLAGGSVEIAGTIGGGTTIAAGRALLRGRIAGDLEVTALSLELAQGARVGGDLIYYGPDPPEIAAGAVIEGELVHELEPKVEEEDAADAAGGTSLFWLLITLGLGLLMDFMLPRYVQSAGARLARHPLACFGLGLAILFVTPVMILILIVSILGIAIGIAAIAAYGTLLLLGPVVALFGATDRLFGRLWPALTSTPARRRLAFVGVLILFGLLAWIPYIGTPLLWIVAVLGLGAATWQLYESVRSSPASAPARTGEGAAP